MYKTIYWYCLKLFELIDLLPDKRKGSVYELSEIITGYITMFVFKEMSCNAFNQNRAEEKFQTNYLRIYKKRIPYMNTVNRVINRIVSENIEGIKRAFVAGLIEQLISTPIN